jgi:hypothetical protein
MEFLGRYLTGHFQNKFRERYIVVTLDVSRFLMGFQAHSKIGGPHLSQSSLLYDLIYESSFLSRKVYATIEYRERSA